MKRTKSVNGYTIYQSVTKRDEENYRCSVGNYNIYISSDIKDFGLSNSYAEWEDVESLAEAINICNGSMYAIAAALADEISGSTAQDMELVLAIEARLDAGEALNDIRADYLEDDVYWADMAAIEESLGLLDDSDDEDELDDMDLEDQFDALLEPGDRADAQHSEPEVYDFCDDEEKMYDFHILTKEEFLASYSYLTEAEYDATAAKLAQHSGAEPKRTVKLPDDDNWPWSFSEYHSDAAKLRARQQHLFPGCPCESDAHSYLTPGVGELAYVHWFSMMNLWMDCFIVVPAELKDAAYQAADEAMELWFDDDCELGEHELYGDTGVCYGEMIEWVLRDRNIPYAIVFGDENWDETDCSDEWNDWAESDWARGESL